MSLILVTGGMRSGKSTYGENLLADKSSILYIATSVVTDEEMEARVLSHQRRRGYRYVTYEGYKNLDQVIMNSKEDAVMIECVGTLITNFMFEMHQDYDNITNDQVQHIENVVMKELDKLLKVVTKSSKTIVIISNEVGFALISEYKMGRIFTDILGRINQKIAKKADRVIMTISGLPMIIKGDS